MTAALIAYVFAQLADIVTTIWALERGGVERNPVILWAMNRFGKGWIVFKLVIAGGVAAAAYHLGLEWALWAIAAFTGFVALRNTRVAR